MSTTTLAVLAVDLAILGIAFLVASMLRGRNQTRELRRSLASLVERRFGALWIVAVPEAATSREDASRPEPRTPTEILLDWSQRQARIVSRAPLDGTVWMGRGDRLKEAADKLSTTTWRGGATGLGDNMYAVVCVSRQPPPTDHDLAKIASYTEDSRTVAILPCGQCPPGRWPVLDLAGWFLCACAVVSAALGSAEWLGLSVSAPAPPAASAPAESPGPDAGISDGPTENGRPASTDR